MPRIKSKVTAKFDRNALRTKYLKVMDQMAEEVAIVSQKEFKKELSHAGHGRVYIRNGKRHRASKPGEPPAPDTRTLKNSIVIKRKGKMRTIVCTAPYGLMLEKGTRYIRPRPWFRTVVKRLRKEIIPKIMAKYKKKLQAMNKKRR